MFYPTGLPLTVKIALGGAVATIGMGVATFVKHQQEMRSSVWLKTIREKLNAHPGVKLLIGEPPVSIGTLTRRQSSYELPSEGTVIDPPSPHLVTMTVKGNQGRGVLYAWLNNPSGKKIENINDWNLAHVELQIGGNREKKMPIHLS